MGTKVVLSINLTNPVHPTPPYWHTQPARLLHTSGLPYLVLQIFLKTLKDPQTLNKQQLASACLVPLAKWPQAWHKP